MKSGAKRFNAGKSGRPVACNKQANLAMTGSLCAGKGRQMLSKRSGGHKAGDSGAG